MKIRLYYLFTILVFVLLLSGCSLFGNTTTITTISTTTTTQQASTSSSTLTNSTLPSTTTNTTSAASTTTATTTVAPTTSTTTTASTSTTTLTTIPATTTELTTVETTTSEMASIAIDNAEDLLAFITSGTLANYYLTDDIDMSEITLTGSNLVFGGTFDGQGHTIRNAVVNSSAQKMGFLFKELVNGAVVKNVIFADSIHNGGGTSESCAFVSAFARGGVLFEDLSFYNVSVVNNYAYAALVFGDVINTSEADTITLRNITVINDDNNEIAAASYIGGLIGSSRQPIIINVENVYFSSAVSASIQACGSIMGRFNAANIHLNVSNAVIKGSTTSIKNVGAVLGVGTSGSDVHANNIFVSSYTGSATGQSTVGIVVGNLNGGTAAATNIYYDSDYTTLLASLVAITISEGSALSHASITEDWFDTSGFDNEFFKYLDNSIARNIVVEGPIEIVGFSVISNNVKKYYFLDEELDLSEMRVYANYSDGSSVLVEETEYTVDSSAFNSSIIGTYPIVVTYLETTKSFTVEVVAMTDIEVNDLLFKNTYLLNEELDLTNLVVRAILSDGSSLILDPSEYTVDTSSFDNQLIGTYELSVTYPSFASKLVKVYVTTNTCTITENLVTVIVDQAYTLDEGNYTGEAHYFSNLKSALLFLENVGLDASVEKIIFIKSGTYYEKIVISIPNLTMIGENKDTTIITYDAASGLQMPNGSNWGTQGSATVAIKSSAVNFMARDITFANGFDYNSSSISDKQAVSLVTEADQVIFYNVNFLGYQDTLYAKYGRQYYINVYIEGVVDFIFGNGGPAYFENSIIKSLARSTGCLSTNKGYTTSISQMLDYGYVFYGNEFIFEEGVPAGSVDLGRPWAPDAAIAYINNTFGAHISARGWTEMSGNLPENARFYEYNNKNTLDELIPTTTLGKTLTALEATSYANKDVVFNQINGDVDFGSVWDYASDLTAMQNIVFFDLME